MTTTRHQGGTGKILGGTSGFSATTIWATALASTAQSTLTAPKRNAEWRSREPRQGWPCRLGRRAELDRSGAQRYTANRAARSVLNWRGP